ncbi:hypothetical protein OSB04_017728 [Centaurea solstitialis]|uniref:AAA+ ATPase domain-containing protein n=1 Tax=Centaurea solstitialis TaxID=347529 RepID=A0AA38TB03_9ASTR|nr:hypothetical protein OSB04_017728 [Centaurea solstitialis]
MASDLIAAIAVKIGEFVFEPFGKSFSYLYHYSKNVTSFQSRVPLLENSRIEIQDLVDEAKRNGEHVLPQVAEWLTAADGFVDESRKFLEDHQVSPSCTNLVSRYRVSKIAKKRVLAVNKLLQDGKFDRVSRQVPPPLWSASTANLETFDSRNLTFKAIMEALKDDNINVIGVYGMGGVGKTTLVKEVAKQASEDKLFDEMVISVISQTMNVRNIQGEIADKLGLKLEQESESGRATRLCQRLKQSTRVLLILDDVWRLLDLEAIGIPHNDVHKGCKLLLTSRSKDVCNEINAQVCVPVNVLSKLDAWNLFSKMANITHDSSDIHLLATKVAERCAGLPIAIVTVARALRGKSKHAWSDALLQLQNPPPKNIKGMQEYVYSSLELSYNFLETDEIKSCFLLCSLFKEDVEIPVEILVRYGMGLRMFQNVYKLEAARDRTYALVEGLKACCLLLDGKNEEYVRMHDVIRDFAILIASSGEKMSLVRHDAESFGSPEGEPLNSFAAISLASTSITELPSGLDCPKLEILLLQFHSDSIQVPANFFEGMKELKVLIMSDMPILSLPSSIRSLWKMRTLCLEHCKLRDISSIGGLISLQILSFLGSNVKRLPEEIGQLTQLKLLDLTDCEELTTIPPKVLSRLSSLESLNMMNSFVNWSGEDKDMQGNNPSLSELKMLPCLRSLEVNILDVNLIPKDLLLENLIKFKIYVGSYWLVSLTHRYTRALKLRVDEGISLPDGLRMLLKQAEYLILEYCPRVLKNILYDLRREGFRNLRGLELYGNCDIEYLVDTIGCKPGDIFPTLEKLEVVSLENLKEICDGHLPVRSFAALQELDLKYLPELICLWKEKDTQDHVNLVNLRNVSVHTCHKLESLFPPRTATDTGSLHDLCIFNCGILRGIFSNDATVAGDGGGQIVLHVLNSLELSLLPQLRSFYPKMNEISISDDDLEIPLFGANVIFPKLQVLRLRELPRVKALWHLQMPEDSFGRLKVLRITRCNAISKLIPFNMVQRLKNLENLSIINCDVIEEIFKLEGLVNVDETTAKLVDLPPLKELVLCGLSELKHLWWNKGPSGYVSLQFLSLLTITRCDSLTCIFSLSALKGLVQLQCLEIEWCALVKEIVSFEIGDSSNMVVFPHLHTIRLNHLPDLTSFYKDHKALDWPSLKILNITNCPNMKTFPASEVEQIVDHAGKLCSTVQPLFNEKVAFPNTEELHIQYMDNLVEVWDHQLPDQTFSSLQVLNVRGCEKLIHVGSTHMLARLQMLSKLYIEDCGSVEEIFVTEHTVNQDDKVVLSLFSLTELRLKSLPKLKHIWWNTDSECEAFHFQNLSSLEVSGCDHLKYILSTSITKGLVQLQELKISSCGLVEVVVLNDMEDQVDVVVLPQLRTLELKNLPSLKSFCSINGMLQLPSLRVLKVMDCPKMKTFASNLTRSDLRLGNEVSEQLLENHLPIITEPFFNGEMRLRMLEKLSIEGLSGSRGLWHDQLLHDSIHRLKVLKVRRCKKLLRLVAELKNLEKLYVEECDSLEEILGIEQPILGGHENHLICMLRDLRLQNLPKLVALWWNNHLNGILKYPKLSSLKIIKCDGLMTVFSVSVVKHFIHLEELHLADCLILKEVIAEDGQRGYAGEKVVFPQLHSLGLINLPNLTSFSLADCMLEFPSLENLNLEECPNMSTFSLGPPVTPKLHAIAVESGEQIWKLDLNSTIKHLFRTKKISATYFLTVFSQLVVERK